MSENSPSDELVTAMRQAFHDERYSRVHLEVCPGLDECGVRETAIRDVKAWRAAAEAAIRVGL